jgi:hypothetical protein
MHDPTAVPCSPQTAKTALERNGAQSQVTVIHNDNQRERQKLRQKTKKAAV